MKYFSIDSFSERFYPKCIQTLSLHVFAANRIHDVTCEDLYTEIMSRSPDSVVWRSTDHQSVSVLKAGDAALVTVKCPYKLTRACAPYLQTHTRSLYLQLRQLQITHRALPSLSHFNGPVSGRRHDVFVVEVHHVDGSTVTHEHPAQADVCGRRHVPHCNGAIFRTRDHKPVTEAQVQNRLVVMDQSVENLTRRNIPNPETHRETQRKSVTLLV